MSFALLNNKFAHSIYPEICDENSTIIKDTIKLEQKEWEEMYDEIRVLYWKIINEIDSNFYSENPRRRKYRRFDEAQFQEVVKYYEGLVEEQSKK